MAIEIIKVCVQIFNGLILMAILGNVSKIYDKLDREKDKS